MPRKFRKFKRSRAKKVKEEVEEEGNASGHTGISENDGVRVERDVEEDANASDDTDIPHDDGVPPTDSPPAPSAQPSNLSRHSTLFARLRPRLEFSRDFHVHPQLMLTETYIFEPGIMGAVCIAGLLGLGVKYAPEAMARILCTAIVTASIVVIYFKKRRMAWNGV